VSGYSTGKLVEVNLWLEADMLPHLSRVLLMGKIHDIFSLNWGDGVIGPYILY
jgi:hypothetical protein